ncbi:MAG: type II toxin-antitoxin system VapC family toxin [Planctomycetia bacterium]|nr:type II toxin-antitoxin system VapC family toxin [Planctomycetia bacterium]
MIVLDTDHVSVLKYQGSPASIRLSERLAAAEDKDIRVAIVTIEEQTRGWLAEINRHRHVHQQLTAYESLLVMFDFFSRFRRLPFDLPAADEFERQRKQKVRIGSMDLKIACIALVHDALLLSANRRDFRLVAGLRLENWLDERKG